jgi:uncharacterized protein YbaA (DUF1428 family)
MAHYTDGYVLPVPKNKLAEYRRIATKAGRLWKEYGALEYKECVAQDMKSPWSMSFPELVKPKKGEVVVFSWIVFKSRKHRDQVNGQVMKDPRLKTMMDPKSPPFDCKRMTYGGFDVIVDF